MQVFSKKIFYTLTLCSLSAAYCGLAAAQPKPAQPQSIFASAIKNLQPQKRKCALLLGIATEQGYETVLLSFDPKSRKMRHSRSLPLLACPQPNKQFYFFYLLTTYSLSSKLSNRITTYTQHTTTKLHLTNNRRYIPQIIEQIKKNQAQAPPTAPDDCRNCQYNTFDDAQQLGVVAQAYASLLTQRYADRSDGRNYAYQSEQVVKCLPLSGAHFKGAFDTDNKTHKPATATDLAPLMSDLCADDLRPIMEWKNTLGMFADAFNTDDSYGFWENLPANAHINNDDPSYIYLPYLQLDTAKVAPQLPADARKLLRYNQQQQSKDKWATADPALAKHYPPYHLSTEPYSYLLLRYEGNTHLVAQAETNPAAANKKTNAITHMVQHSTGILPQYEAFPLDYHTFTYINPSVMDVMVSPTHDVVVVYLSDGTIIAIDATTKHELLRYTTQQPTSVVMVEWTSGIYTDIWQNELSY